MQLCLCHHYGDRSHLHGPHRHIPYNFYRWKQIHIRFYDYDSNNVLSAPMKNRGDNEMVRAFDLLIQSLIIHGPLPLLQCLDNETSLTLRN
jgi:hypothetical protein